jgi:hypothetical protein
MSSCNRPGSQYVTMPIEIEQRAVEEGRTCEQRLKEVCPDPTKLNQSKAPDIRGSRRQVLGRLT